MRGKQGVVKVGGDDDGILLIIMACMAQYCNCWRKRKSPIDGNIIAGISRRVGGQRGGVEDIIMDGVGVVFHPYTYPTITYYCKRLEYMS
jgi:hypothetical protein